MNEKSMLSSPRLPARLSIEEVAEILGFLPYEVTVIFRGGLLRPLGKPAPNSHKFFCTAEVLELSQNRDWLDKATRAVAKCWHEKNLKAKAAAPVT